MAVAGGLRSRAEEGRRRLLLRGGWAGTVDQETQHAGTPEEAGPGPWRWRDLPPQGGAEVIFLRLLISAFPRNNMAHIGSRATATRLGRAFSERRRRSSASLTTWLPASVPLLSPGPATTKPQLPGHGRKWPRNFRHPDPPQIRVLNITTTNQGLHGSPHFRFRLEPSHVMEARAEV